MSVADQIQALNDGLLDCYTAVQTKGGTVPENKNLDNLPDAIESISGGAPTADPYITFSTESGTNSLSLASKIDGLNLEYSYDTTTWTTWDLTTPLEFGGATELYMRGTNDKLSTNGNVYTQFAFSDNTVLVDCKGRINKLLRYNLGDGYDYSIKSSYCFFNLFSGCVALRTAPELPAAVLTTQCYYGMFKDCSSLLKAPELPSKETQRDCYREMFLGCSSLVTAPTILPAMILANSCYWGMFSGCTSLTVAPELPATTVESSCCREMFSGCSSLVTAPAILPAMTLNTDCYLDMFKDCSSLTIAPELPAPTIAFGSYMGLFSGCKNLAYIKCLAENPSFSLNNGWTMGVTNKNGTFVKKAGVTYDTSWGCGIPTGWTVEEV